MANKKPWPPIGARVLALGVLAACTLSPATADVSLSKAFGDHMVLQRGMKANIWGWADPGEKVTVQFGAQNLSTTADTNGKWSVKLAPMKANNDPQDLIVTGKNSVKLTDILVGDVWLCSGQSNMAFSLGGCNAPKDIETADFPNIRYRGYFECFIGTPQENVQSVPWKRIGPESAAGCTAVGFYFARKINAETGVPIGLLESTVGGTEIECWMPPSAFSDYPACAGIGKALQDAVDQYNRQLPKALDDVEKWLPIARQALADNKPLPHEPRVPLHPNEDRSGRWVRIQSLYNGMIHPFTPFTIKGAIWYQGENNGSEEQPYVDKLTAMVGSWRKLWGYEFPFYYVQLANYRKASDDPNANPSWGYNRMAMLRCLSIIPKTGMAVATDVGDADDIHPKNKFDVGERLALWALAKDYGKTDIVYSGPLYKGMQVGDGKIRISFDHVGSGLMVGEKNGLRPAKEVKDGKLKRFAVAGEDKVWHWADAVIDGKTVVVSSPDVAQPVAVRYAFSDNPEGANLYNKDGLPASPFRTDNW